MRKGVLGGITIILMIVCGEQVRGGAGRAPGGAVTVKVLENSPERVVIRYKFGDFRRWPVPIDGRIFTQIYLGNESLKKEKGAPGLPDVSRSIVIPDAARMKVDVLDGSYYEIDNIDIAPSKGHCHSALSTSPVALFQRTIRTLIL